MSIKTILVTSILTMGITGAAIAANISAKENKIQQATYIKLVANEGQENNLADFLKVGAQLVRETEPNTKLWFALKENDGKFAIFDVFPDEAGRKAHFDGKVAAALKENSKNLVFGNWDAGVLNNIQNAEIISSNKYRQDRVINSKKASYILLKALPEKGEELAQFLTKAASLVSETEPNTLFWLALKIDNNSYAIFDTFSDESARQSHFAGLVAGKLKENAGNLVEGGWENGVLKHVYNFDILASS